MVVGVGHGLAGLGIMIVIMIMRVAVHLVPVAMLMFVNELGRPGILLRSASAILAHVSAPCR